MKFINLEGKRFGRLTVLADCNREQKEIRWMCRCDCGAEKLINGYSLRKGLTKSCGCLQAETTAARSTKHGNAKRNRTSPEYNIWAGMMGRCYVSTHTSYGRYGALGIKVCERWHRFENFLADMGMRPAGKSIGRIDGLGDYELKNCRWETSVEQANNRKSNQILEFNGKRNTVANWARATGIKPATISARLRLLNYSVEQALTQPVRGLRR